MTKPNRRQFLESTLAASVGIVGSSFCKTPAASAGSPQALSSYDKRVSELLRVMTLEEKVGQMTQAEQNALFDVGDIEKLFLGSLLSGGSSDPKAGNSLEAWTD